MAQDNRGATSSREGRPGGGPGRDRRQGPGGKRGGPHKGGFGKAAPKAPVRIPTYETVKELTRGADFRIDKFQIAEKGTGRPVKTEYRLTRAGLNGVHTFNRLSDAQTAATAPLPEPDPAPAEQAAENAEATETAEISELEKEGSEALPAETADHSASEEPVA